MADDRDKPSNRHRPGTEPPPPPSDEDVARVARALGVPLFHWSDTVDGDAVKSDELPQPEVE